MAEKLVFEKKIDGINVRCVIDDIQYSPEQEIALWKDLIRAVSSAIEK